MDPISIAAGCAGLISAIGTLSFSIHGFVRTCREARRDLDRVSRELRSLQLVLELIQEDATDKNKPFPSTIGQHVSGIVSNCSSVVLEIQSSIRQYGDKRVRAQAAWAASGQSDIEKLRTSLEAHKTALELALDMLALTVTKEIKSDTTELRNDTATIKEDTAKILQEIARLQARLPSGIAAPNDFVLQRFLEEMTEYTEATIDATLVGEDDDGNMFRALSHIEEREESVLLPAQDLLNPPSPKRLGRILITPNEPRELLKHHDSEPTKPPSAPVPNQVRHDSSRGKKYRQHHMQSYFPTTDPDPTSAEFSSTLLRPSPPSPPKIDSASGHVVSFKGNLVLDCLFPKKTLDLIERAHKLPCSVPDEFTHWRFTAVTCPPEQVVSQNYVLRPSLFPEQRSIKAILSFNLDAFSTPHRFARQWDLIRRSIKNLRHVDEWQTVIVHIHTNSWPILGYDISMALKTMGARQKLPTTVKSLDGGLLDSPYQDDSTTLQGERVYGTIREYSTKLYPRVKTFSRHKLAMSLSDTPIQVISTMVRDPSHPMSNSAQQKHVDWKTAIGHLLKPELIIDMTSLGRGRVTEPNPLFLQRALLPCVTPLETETDSWGLNLRFIDIQNLLLQLRL